MNTCLRHSLLLRLLGVILGQLTFGTYLIAVPITYQGLLTDNGVCANGTYDFQIVLYGSESGGTPIGSSVLVEDVLIKDGVFSVELDFGESVFDGSDRWLELQVRPGESTEGHSVLQPRQPIRPAPYAIRSLSQDVGTQGPAGPAGPAGPPGPSGAKGDKGDQGAIGETGAQGAVGPKGETGPAGPKGEKGDKGETGAPGSADSWGRSGNSGTNPTTEFLGTTDNTAFQIRANNLTAMEIIPRVDSSTGNPYSNVILGGGVSPLNNSIGLTNFGSNINGGAANTAAGNFSAIGGGNLNEALGGNYLTVGGGFSNKIEGGGFGTIGGGRSNLATGAYATVGGGGSCVASGQSATVPGGSGNTASGNRSFAAGSGAIAQHDGAFVWADDGNDPVASSRNNEFKVRSTGGARFEFNNGNHVLFYEWKPLLGPTRTISTSSGAYLSLGGTWTNSSDREQKTDIKPVDHQQILSRLLDLPVSSWRYRSEVDGGMHIGPMAQDFNEAFELSGDPKAIATVDADGVALTAIKALHEIVEQQQHELHALRLEIQELKNAKE